MIGKLLEAITKADIDSLIENAVREGRIIEFKAILPGPKDEDKREFLADVSSFANAAGGDLLFGVAATDGVAKKAPGLVDCNHDTVTQRLDSLLRDCIDPRIPAIRTRFVEGFERGPVLVLRVPKSWSSPHMVTFGNLSRFYSRNNAGKYQLEVSEIRAAFALSEELPQRIKRFRDERFGKIVAEETPVPLARTPKIILHVFPFVAFSTGVTLGSGLMRQHHALLQAFDPGSYDTRINIDGVLNLSGKIGDTGTHFYYCQAFRNGVIESVDASLLDWGDKKLIPNTAFVKDLIASVRSYLDFMRALDVPPPFVVSCALLGVKGFSFPRVNPFPSDPILVDRDLLILPDVVFEDLDSDVPRKLQPMLDGLWNAVGKERCSEYDADGTWNPKTR